MRREDDEVMKT